MTIRNEEDVAKACRYPVLAMVPDMEGQPKGSYYRYDKRHAYSKAKTPAKQEKKTPLVGNVSFVASEAYKLLRTKLQFSFADEKNCHVIGVSSALTGEGKSVSSANLAYTIAQLGKRVLLIDCDMRRPAQAEYLPVRRAPGLSDYLTGYRIEMAKNMLRQGDMSIAAISEAVGYADSKYFSRIFTRLVGIKPSAYRTLHG